MIAGLRAMLRWPNLNALIIPLVTSGSQLLCMGTLLSWPALVFLAMDSESTDVMAPWLKNKEAHCSLWKQEEEIGGKATTRRRVLTRER